MKFYLVFYLDAKNNNNVVIKRTYETKEDAENNVIDIALDIIRCEEGKKHLTVALQKEKTPEEIKNDEMMREGLYLFIIDGVVSLYEKKKRESRGYIITSYCMVMNLVGTFGVTEVYIDVPDYTDMCSCIRTTKVNTKKSMESKPNITYLTQINEIFKNHADKCDESDEPALVKPSSLNYEKSKTKRRVKEKIDEKPIIFDKWESQELPVDKWDDEWSGGTESERSLTYNDDEFSDYVAGEYINFFEEKWQFYDDNFTTYDYMEKRNSHKYRGYDSDRSTDISSNKDKYE